MKDVDVEDVQLGTLGIDGVGDPNAIMAEQKQGGKCCLCCCDYRRAVIIMSAISLLLCFLGFIPPRKPHAAMDNAEEFVNEINDIQEEWRGPIMWLDGISIIFYGISFWGALKFQHKLVRFLCFSWKMYSFWTCVASTFRLWFLRSNLFLLSRSVVGY